MIIGISGKMHSGKDTFAGMMQELQPGMFWENKKFAGKLKKVASLITGVPVEKFEDSEFKSQHMGDAWGMTYREFLQRLGTEAFRNGVHNNIWINALFADYKPNTWAAKKDKNDFAIVDVYPNWIITDVRFISEAEYIRTLGFPLVRITRTGNSGSHQSETELDHYGRFDFDIDNTGSLHDLQDCVKRIASQLDRFIQA